MILIACVEDAMGMMFHERRVSRDKAVCEDILRTSRDGILYMEEYSRRLFQEFDAPNISLTEGSPALDSRAFQQEKDGVRGAAGPLDAKQAESGKTMTQYFFAERPGAVCEADISEMILYRWNRRYPADQYFPIDLDGWELLHSEEFAGTSHDKITKESWRRRK